MKMMVDFYQKRANAIKQGNEYTLYLVYCDKCKEYKRIYSSAPAGPGGTLSCPICRERKENGPHLEGAYGSVKVKPFKIKLPNEVEI